MRASAALLLAAALLGGCAAFDPPQTRQLAVSPPPGLPAQVERSTVPFFPQTPYHCGPAALATVLSDAGLPTQPDELADSVFLPGRQGSLQAEMLSATRRRGALAYRLPGTLDALLAEVAAGQAVVVLQNLGLAISPRWHYAVVVGYDLAEQQVLMRSGTTEREAMHFATFERTWARGGHWAIVALPPGRMPARVDEAAAAEAAVGFERTAAPADAARAYETLLRRWPDNLVAGMGLGNARYAAGDRPGAAAAFEAVAGRHDSAAAWNNLARVRLDLGQTEAALAAAQRAMVRAEAAEPAWRDSARRTLLDVRAASPRPQ